MASFPSIPLPRYYRCIYGSITTALLLDSVSKVGWFCGTWATGLNTMEQRRSLPTFLLSQGYFFCELFKLLSHYSVDFREREVRNARRLYFYLWSFSQFIVYYNKFKLLCQDIFFKCSIYFRLLPIKHFKNIA